MFLLAAVGFARVRPGFDCDTAFVTLLAMTLAVPCPIFVCLAAIWALCRAVRLAGAKDRLRRARPDRADTHSAHARRAGRGRLRGTRAGRRHCLRSGGVTLGVYVVQLSAPVAVPSYLLGAEYGVGAEPELVSTLMSVGFRPVRLAFFV